MSLKLDIDLTPEQQKTMAGIPAQAWFTQVKFRNAISPRHPEADDLDQNHEPKKKLMLPWITANVKGKRVLDLFCANGAFSFECMRAGATEVVGMEFSPERVQCGQFIASTLNGTNQRRSLNYAAFDFLTFAHPALCAAAIFVSRYFRVYSSFVYSALASR